MNFLECAGKSLLAMAGISIPEGQQAMTVQKAVSIAQEIGPCVIKAQVPTGKRGKAGGIQLAFTTDEVRLHAENILGMKIGGEVVEKLLIEEQIPISCELYAAILTDPDSKGPLILFASQGGMDIEEIAIRYPEKLMRLPVNIRKGFDLEQTREALPALEGIVDERGLLELLSQLYRVYIDHDAELLEINPLTVTDRGQLVAADCKFTLDDSAIKRQRSLAKQGVPDRLTELEARAQTIGFKYVELDGNVGILANGAGLTMTSMDAVVHYGGKPANFLEIGGEAYSLGKEALETVLSNHNVKSLLINFCGAFARTDVMTEGIVRAWEAINPTVPVFFTIHGTGEDVAVDMIKTRLGVEPYDLMDDAVKAAVKAAQ